QGVAVDPKDPSLGLALGIALSQNGNTAEAIHTLESVASAHPDFADGHFNLATLYAQDHRYLEAAKEYGEALRLQPQNDLARLSQAKALVTLAEYAKALPLLQEYIKQKPQDYEGYYLDGMVDRGLGNYSEAELKLRRALELNPAGNYGMHYELGAVLEKLGRLDEARTHLERAEQLDAGSQEVRFHLANVLRKLHDEHRAGQELQAFQKMKEQGIQSARVGALANKANQLMEQGDARGAVAVYQQSLKLEPNDAKLYYNLSLAFNKLNDRSEEVSALRKAVAIDPDYGLAHNQLGLVYLAQANLAEAEQEFKTTLKIDSHFAEAENNLGVLYGQQGKNEEAEKLFRQAVEDNPLYGQAFANLGLILASQQRFEEAERQLRHALEITPKYSGALTALGRVQADAGRTRESVETFRRVVAL